MVTTPYNFKQWFKRHYPDIRIYPVYGMEAYTFDKPLNPEDMFTYNAQQLPSGQYIIFVGKTPEQIMELMRSIKEHGLQYIRLQKGIPTTFSSFENWYRNKQLKPLFRTHCAKMTANEALHTSSDDPSWNQKRDWYMYEFSLAPSNPAREVFAKDTMKFSGPYTETESGTIVLLIKASTNTYISKRQLFLQKFTTMQPLFEQLVVSCAQGDWERATSTAEQYMGIQFDATGTVDGEALKKAFEDGELALFVRCRSNLKEEAEDEQL